MSYEGWYNGLVQGAIASANSASDRKGDRSSNGADTIEPSGRRRLDSLGSNCCALSIITSHNCGPGASMVARIAADRSASFSARRAGKPKPVARRAKSGNVSPLSGPQPTEKPLKCATCDWRIE